MSRFASSNFHDQSAAVWIVTLLLLSYTTLTSLVRGYVKSGVLGLDDCLAGAAQLLAYGNIFSVIHALLHGLAKEREQTAGFDKDLKYGKALQASIILDVLVLAAAKMSAVCFLRRIFRRAFHNTAMLVCNCAIVVMGLWGIGSALAVSANCSVEHMWRFAEEATCAGGVRWTVVAVLDGIAEIGLMVVTVWFVSRLQMKVKDKVAVCSAFVWWIALVVFAAFHNRSYHQILHSSDTDVAVSKLITWEQISMCYTLLSITWPFSKAFVNSFDTAPLAGTSTHGSGAAVAPESAKTKSKSRVHPGRDSKRQWQTSGVYSNAVHCLPSADKGNIRVFESQEMIIRREDEIEVTYER